MPAHLPSDRLQQGLQDLRDGFLERITTRVLAMEAILAAAMEADEEFMSDADRQAIQQHAHKTAGVAATFGLSVLGDKAFAVEGLVSRTEAALPWSVARPVVEDLLDEMEDALDEFA